MRNAIEILKEKGWEVNDDTASKRTSEGCSVSYAGYGRAYATDCSGKETPLDDSDIEALIESRNAVCEEDGDPPKFAVLDAKQEEKATATAQEASISFGVDEARRILFALKTTGTSVGWSRILVGDLVERIQHFVEDSRR